MFGWRNLVLTIRELLRLISLLVYSTFHVHGLSMFIYNSQVIKLW